MNQFTELPSKGYFWLPNRLHQRVPGWLRRDSDGTISLETIGNLPKAPLPPGSRILGELENETPVTLEHCYHELPGSLSESDNSKNILFSQPIRVPFLIIGRHFDVSEAVEFNKIACSSNKFNKWFQSRKLEVPESSDSAHTLVNHVLPDKKEWNFSVAGEKYKISLHCDLTQLPSPGLHEEIHITPKTWVEFELSGNKPYQELLSLVHQLRAFISFASDYPVPIPRILANSESNVNHNTLVEVCYPASEIYPAREIHAPKKSSMPHLSGFGRKELFSFESVQEKFGDFLSKWGEIHRLFNWYSLSRREDILYSDNRLLILVQTLEGLHKLKRKKDITLKSRLKSLFHEFNQIFSDNEGIKIRSEAMEKMISHVVHVRNQLAHQDESKENSDYVLYFLCIILEVLFQVHVMRFLGFSAKEVADLYTHYSKPQILCGILQHLGQCFSPMSH